MWIQNQNGNDRKKPYKISSERTPNRAEEQRSFKNYEKIYSKSRSYQKSKFLKQVSNKYPSERYFKRQNLTGQQDKMQGLNEKKYKSYSETKNKSSRQKQKQEFLIRIPKDQNLIENYIQQLKKLKRKIISQKSSLNEYKQNYNSKPFQKIQNSQKNVIEENNILSNFRSNSKKYEQKPSERLKLSERQNPLRINVNNRKVFARDMKKHMTKLKIVKQFINENESDEHQQQKQKQFNLNEKEKQEQNEYINSRQKYIFPRKIVYGNIIQVKQSINIKNPFQHKKFNRYSSQSGRKLYSISKSVDLKPNSKVRANSEQKIKPFVNSTSLYIRKKSQNSQQRKYQQLNIKNQSPMKPINLTNKFNNSLKESPNDKNCKKFGPQKRISPQKGQKQSPLKSKDQSINNGKKPFQSIEGFSTIQDKKQTLDVLGQSCMQIKQNLVNSNKKMDCILDLLGYDTTQLKDNCIEKQRRKKLTFQRFSRVFPKGFFK